MFVCMCVQVEQGEGRVLNNKRFKSISGGCSLLGCGWGAMKQGWASRAHAQRSTLYKFCAARPGAGSVSHTYKR